MAKLEPVDRAQCQVDVPTGRSFMSFGPGPTHARCKEIPVVVVREKKAGADGKRGAMSMCARCLAVFRDQVNIKIEDYVIRDL